MNSTVILLGALLLTASSVVAQDNNVIYPTVITPGQTNSQPPSDAIVLFNGSDFSQWESTKTQSVNGKAEPVAIAWKLEEGAMVMQKGAGSIKTKESFGDCQLHIEWRAPREVEGDGQGRGNSGIFLQGLYEVQVLDSYNNKTYPDGQAGSIYTQYPPLVNVCRKPGEWQTYDIVFKEPRFDAQGKLLTSAYFTVFQNGVLVQYHVEVKGTTYNKNNEYKTQGPQPLQLQDHGNPVAFRNVWLRKL